ncbi:MAG: 30S ribosomal protein S6 [Endomicrobium sp.]|jgi:small subunit ribosomal protein S6|nr:30S ribosomal protein S6 [Endomicrobium sp.]
MNYESTFIVSPELSTEKIEEVTAKAIKTVETSKGTIKTVQQLGKKRLSYFINKFREGSYVYMEFSGNGETINALESFFKFNDSIIRFLTIKVEKKKVVKEQPVSTAESQIKEAKQNESTTEQFPLA